MARVAVVLANDFEDSEFTHPYRALLESGHVVDIIGVDTHVVTGKKGTAVTPDLAADDATADDYDGLLVPGGFSPDRLRTSDAVVSLVRDIANSGAPVAAICHAPSLLIEADVVKGRTLTSYTSIRTDLVNAGADVVDRQLVIDGNLITSRTPDDLDAFTPAFIEALG